MQKPINVTISRIKLIVVQLKVVVLKFWGWSNKILIIA